MRPYSLSTVGPSSSSKALSQDALNATNKHIEDKKPEAPRLDPISSNYFKNVREINLSIDKLPRLSTDKPSRLSFIRSSLTRAFLCYIYAGNLLTFILELTHLRSEINHFYSNTKDPQEEERLVCSKSMALISELLEHQIPPTYKEEHASALAVTTSPSIDGIMRELVSKRHNPAHEEQNKKMPFGEATATLFGGHSVALIKLDGTHLKEPLILRDYSQYTEIWDRTLEVWENLGACSEEIIGVLYDRYRSHSQAIAYEIVAYLPGFSLGEKERRDQLTMHEKLTIIKIVLQHLSTMLEHNLFWGDLKLDNILVNIVSDEEEGKIEVYFPDYKGFLPFKNDFHEISDQSVLHSSTSAYRGGEPVKPVKPSTVFESTVGITLYELLTDDKEAKFTGKYKCTAPYTTPFFQKFRGVAKLIEHLIDSNQNPSQGNKAGSIRLLKIIQLELDKCSKTSLPSAHLLFHHGKDLPAASASAAAPQYNSD